MKSSDQDFVAEAEELLDDVGHVLVELQDSPSSEPNPDSINSLFRAMHTMKGMAGIYGYQGLSDISHALENLLDDVRMGKVAMTSEVVAFLFRFVDILRSLLEGVMDKSSAEEINYMGHLVEIEQFRTILQAKAEKETSGDELPHDILRVLSEYEEHRLRHNIKKGNAIYLLSLAFSLMDFDTELKKITDRIKTFGELISTMPTSENVPSGSIGFNLMVGCQLTSDELGAEVATTPKTIIRGKMQQPPAPAVLPQPQETQAGTLKSTTTTVRVNIDKLDRILNTLSEVSLIKAASRNIWDGLIEAYGHTPLLIDMYRINQSFDRRLTELQRNVLELRMVPVAQMFGRLGQIIRRQSRDIGKRINLETYGEDTEIDKYLAEEIIDPLMHIVRNSIDHGIEDPAERAQAQKSDIGTISLHALQKGDSVVVEVRDDGRGIDMEKIRKKAVEKGIISAEADIPRRELMSLIFMPGFSTKDSVSEVSGRGVGLDVVKNKLASLGALVDIDTEQGKGTRFILTLPITIAIIKSLLVRVGDEIFAVPISALQETMALDHSLLRSVETKMVYGLRGEMLPMIYLDEMLQIPSDSDGRKFAFIVGIGERRLGVIVDEILGQQDVVIKPMSEYLGGVRGFAGAAEISRHRVILVLDVESMIEESVIKRNLPGV